MTDAEKTRETRLRRMAERQGLRLVKSRRRDPNALGFGCYMLTDPNTNAAVGPDAIGPTGEPDWTLDDVQDWLTGERR